LLVLSAAQVCYGADSGKSYSSPEDAVTALVSAVTSKDTNALRVIFGSAADDLQNPDRVQAGNDLNTFAAAITLTNRLVRQSDTKYELEIGAASWPFPIPLVKETNGWVFDTEAGKDELLNRRIGNNELETLKVVRAFVDAQREYASKDRDGDEVLEYAQRITSSPDKTDGLFWPIELNGEVSPLGPLVAEAQTEGYFADQSSDEPGPNPFHGYLFKILTRQGKHAPGGKYNYIINGHMIGGFALVAWPASYGESGIMTFIVNQQGRVYQKDLGPATSKIVRKMKEYDCDPTWRVSQD
jgi:hypothetical protein